VSFLAVHPGVLYFLQLGVMCHVCKLPIGPEIHCIITQQDSLLTYLQVNTMYMYVNVYGSSINDVTKFSDKINLSPSCHISPQCSEPPKITSQASTTPFVPYSRKLVLS